MRKIIISIFIAFALIACGCVGDTEADTGESIEDYSMFSDTEYTNDIVVLEATQLSHNTAVYKLFDEEEDAIIYVYAGYKQGGITAMSKNEIEYWKNFDESEE